MANLDSRGQYLQLVALLQPGEDLVVMRCEVRDYQYRLVTRTQSSPTTGGGTELVVDRALAVFKDMLYAIINDRADSSSPT